MKKTSSAARAASAERIARLADKGEDISRFFTGPGRMVRPPVPTRPVEIQRVNVDVTAAMLSELDQAAQEMNISRQAVIKSFVRQALDQHYLAVRARRS